MVMLLITVFVPVIGAFLLPLVGKINPKIRNILAFIMVLIPLIGAFFALPQVLKGEPYYFNILLPLGFNFGLLADGLAIFMAIISTLVGLIIVFYSFGYMSHYKNLNEYYLMVVLFIGSMMGIVFSTNLIFLYLFWEISAICCWRLIGFFREKAYVLRADKAFLITVFGALVMLIGFIMIYQNTGTFDLTQMHGTYVSDLAVLLILFGILSKSATLPLHTWLPDAGVAPSPVTSLLHAAVLVKIGVYVYARLFLINFNFISDGFWHTAIPIIAAVSAIVSAGAALIETDLKRIIAYSTVSQIGFIFLGLSVGSNVAIAGGLLYILMHGVAKGGLFLCAGIIEQNTKTKDIKQLGGLINTMPVTAVAFLICAFSIMGIPPLGGFFSKYMVIGGAVNADHPWIALTFVIGAILTILYLFRVFTMVFMGKTGISTAREGSMSMLISVVVLSVLAILSGILINFPADFVNQIVTQMGGMIK